MQTLLYEVEARHMVLMDLLDRATTIGSSSTQPGEQRVSADRFLASASRHVAGTTDVLLPAVKGHLASGGAEVREFVRECKRLERTLVKAKAKQYGQGQTVQLSWTSLWSEVRDQLHRTARAERRLAAMLGEHLDHEAEKRLGQRLAAVVAKAQTRPHPHLPHTGLGGRIARRLCSKFDVLWDELEGRVTSEARVELRVHEAARGHAPSVGDAAA